MCGDVVKKEPFVAVMICIPEPWKHDDTMDLRKKDFYHYWATMMEPWDGPAAILFSDGDVVGATLDRNGLRPSRYYITKDNELILSSEVGVLDIPESQIVKKSRLMPGRILLVDTKQKKLISDYDAKSIMELTTLSVFLMKPKNLYILEL